jgi:oligopeptide transport system substrate-binding protein
MIGIDAKERDMSRLKLPLLLFVPLAAALIVAGCARQEPTAATLNMASGEPYTLDPSLAVDLASQLFADALFYRLTDVDEQTNEVIPALAKEWQVSDDGLVWTFRLRDDVYWVHYDPESKEAEKKRKVTAHDVEYGVKRTLDPATASETAFVDYVILNAFEVNTGEIEDIDAIGVQALDDHTVQFTLKEPAPYFLHVSGLHANYPLPREAIEQDGDEWTEAGNIWTCGPYMLDTWEHNSRVVLVKNPHWVDAKNVSIETVNLLAVADNATALAMYEAGELDTVAVGPADKDRIQADPELSQQLHVGPKRSCFFVGFNVSKPPLDNRLLRKALSAAIDRQKLIQNVLRGANEPARSFACQGQVGSPAGDASFEGITFDPEQARQWLAEAGYPNGEGFPEVTFMSSSSSYGENDYPRIAEFVQKQWADHLGINVKLTSQEWKVYVQTLTTDTPPIWEVGWFATYPDENSWVTEAFHPTKGVNFGDWDPEDSAAKRFMELTEAAAREMDPERRKALYFEAEKILCQDEAIIAPLFHGTWNWLSKPYLQRTYTLISGLNLDEWKILPH